MKLLKSIGLAFLAPAIAVVVAVVATTVVLIAAGSSPSDFFTAMFSDPLARIKVNIVNQTALIYISAVASAIGFRMGLFNIGIEGQYTIASFAAASFAGAAWLSGFANIAASLVIAIVVGAVWSGIAGILKTTRGVSEVISTIMLNSIAVILVGYLINRYGVHQGNSVHTKKLAPSSTLTGFTPFEARDGQIWALALLAIFVGIWFWILLNKTRFGFDLRASGQSATAATASGINADRMVLTAMLLSGGVAGLIWMPALFGGAGSYGTTFQAGLGFTGIAVALLGRNQPLGIAFGAVLFAFLTAQSNTLTFNSDISPSIIEITQGVAVLAVVIAYEVVRRYRVKLDQRAVARELAPEERAVVG